MLIGAATAPVSMAGFWERCAQTSMRDVDDPLQPVAGTVKVRRAKGFANGISDYDTNLCAAPRQPQGAGRMVVS